MGSVNQFYDHFFSWGIQKNISDLTKLRKRLGINAASKITIEVAEADLYVANIENRLIVKIGSRCSLLVVCLSNCLRCLFTAQCFGKGS
jgi:alpha-amylase